MKNIIRLTESDLMRIVKKVLNEQGAIPSVSPTKPTPGVSPTKPTPGVSPTKSPMKAAGGGGQYGPYCKIGTAQGIIKQHTTGTSGPNVNLGETGFGLFDTSGKLICKISTKYTQGGYVATKSS